jgi:hypothetical protein
MKFFYAATLPDRGRHVTGQFQASGYSTKVALKK